MLFRSTAEVRVPAHKVAQFKRALLRHAPSEHSGIGLGPVTAYELRREGPNAVVRVLIDSTVLFGDDHDEFASDWETEESRSAADESIGYAIARVGGDWNYELETKRAE